MYELYWEINQITFKWLENEGCCFNLIGWGYLKQNIIISA
jgi:hypothetical protein